MMKNYLSTSINLQRLQDDFVVIEKHYAIDEQNSYIQSYPALLAFFSEKERPLTKNDFIAGAHMVYGWMPTIITFNKGKMTEALSAINRAKKGELLSFNDLEAVKFCVNNSMVGASKLLHFINPGLYPIWDSKVCRYVTGMAHQQKVNNVTNYLLYIDLCKHLTAQKEFDALYTKAKKIAGMEISPFRAVELIMFLNSNLKIKINEQ